ncbi:hypothetical protein [Zymobacter palmae]|uniref:Pyruvate:ferredoxin oxidoreductase n=1 Tax=Zymobacter palmae TaxID=33074 RepID=A0A348HD88_9GAMM|nr:hypothetical protein [Zymobacter palmae]BBG29590.1 pyruvate:ferredoxin oxidoreductase [Zymobacter palmae]
MKRIVLAMALSAVGLPLAAVAAPASQPAVDAYYHDMLSITHDANQAGEACMSSLKNHRSSATTPACRTFEQRYQRAVDQSESLAARLKVAGQTLHRSDPRLAQLTRATETLNHYMDNYQDRPSAGEQDGVMHIMEEPMH